MKHYLQSVIDEAWVYDLEILPNFFSAVFVRIDNSETKVFYHFEDHNGIPEMRQWLRSTNPTLVGWNNYKFDNLILATIGLYPNIKLSKLYAVAQSIIGKNFTGQTSKRVYARAKKIKSVDVMQLLGYVSLKEVAGKLGLSVMEMPIQHYEYVREDQVDMILDYNVNDVLVTLAAAYAIEDVIKTRWEVGGEFGIDAMNSTDSTLANKMLNQDYGRPDIEGTPRNSIKLADVISPLISFKSETLNQFLDELKGITVYRYVRKSSKTPSLEFGRKPTKNENKISDGYKYKINLDHDGITYNLGIGGLHSQDKGGIFETTEKLIVRDADVSSYYPFIMLNLGVFPEHLGEDFLDYFGGKVWTRIDAKKAGDKTKAGGLKITINAIFGKLGSEFFWLYDPKAMVSVTINGQLLLIMLIERLHNIGIHTISANTDGIVCKVPVDRQDEYYEVCRQWEADTKFELEYNDYELYVRRDVNNYVTRTTTGKIKQKGAFITIPNIASDIKRLFDTGEPVNTRGVAPYLKKAHIFPIVAKALNEYYLNGVPVMDSIMGEKDINQFCYIVKTSKDWEVIMQTKDGDTPLQNINRVYVAKKGGFLTKIKKQTGKRLVVRKSLMQVINEKHPQMRDDIDYHFYYKEAMKVVNEVTPAQMKLF